ncbi:MAG: hypothetical protein MSC30_16995 [Gaiellaceae bacterium MAG52_C11]|nr:hypothetical protein [Candidatus Gaiellasilicea maunaloa]
MAGFIAQQIWRRRARSGALAAGMLLASVSFVLLASAAETSDIRVRGSVESNFRNAYDILVRPRGSFTTVERELQLVRDNYLGGIYGGISMSEYRAIRQIHGVEVAAPIANVGYVMPTGFRFFSTRRWLTDDEVQMFRVRFGSEAHAGTSMYPDDIGYAYFTRRNRFKPGTVEVLPGGTAVNVCSYFAASVPGSGGPFAPTRFLNCFSERSPGRGSDVSIIAPRGDVGVRASVSFPILIAAIDPVAEARLVGLDDAIVSGRYLRPNDQPYVEGVRWVPVIAAGTSVVDETVVANVERLDVDGGNAVPRALGSRSAFDFVTALGGSRVGRESVSASEIYEQMLGTQFGSNSYWRPSETQYHVLRRQGEIELVPVATTNPESIWANKFNPTGFTNAPSANQDVQFRQLRQFTGSNLILDGAVGTPSFEVVGRYDTGKLPGFSALSRVPLETYYPPQLLPADALSRTVLKGKALRPSQNLGDYIQQPPLFLTTLAGIRPFLDANNFSGADAKAPISVIRVRVSGVTGPDPLSMARIRAVALEIREKTGLDVDITAGSSPRELLVRLPEGKFGRPELLLKEGWVKKGVSVAFLRAIDRKSLALLGLVLLTCGFFVANGAFAVVRARRSEIGTLLCVGWPQRSIFAALLGELALLGVLAGTVGAIVAALIVVATPLEMPLWRAVLVVPVAVALALLAGLVPARAAARSVPLDAVRPVVATGRAAGRVHGLAGLAAANLRRVPSRTLVAVLALLVGVASFALLLAIQRAFEGRLVDTLLGQAIVLRVQAVDYLAVAVVIGLAAFSIADVLFLNLRERAAELVTLRTFGWEERHLRRLVGLEALGFGLLGGSLGALAALLIGVLALDVPAGSLALASLVGLAGGVAVGMVASIVPLTQIQRLTAPTILAEE